MNVLSNSFLLCTENYKRVDCIYIGYTDAMGPKGMTTAWLY